jgi:hypothetical protein
MVWQVTTVRVGRSFFSSEGGFSKPLHCLITSAGPEKTLGLKGVQMRKHHLFNLLIAIALVILIALTVREAFATSITTSQTHTAVKCDSLPSRYSIHTEEVKETGRQVSYTEDGPTGVDGGLVYLLSAYRTCSR